MPVFEVHLFRDSGMGRVVFREGDRPVVPDARLPWGDVLVALRLECPGALVRVRVFEGRGRAERQVTSYRLCVSRGVSGRGGRG